MDVGNPYLNIAIFLAFVVVTLVIVVRVSRTTTSVGDFYHGGRAFTGRQNGSNEVAIAAELRAADRVHAGVQDEQPPLAQPMPDRGPREAELEHLLARDHAVLPPADLPCLSTL